MADEIELSQRVIAKLNNPRITFRRHDGYGDYAYMLTIESDKAVVHVGVSNASLEALVKDIESSGNPE